MAGREIVTVEGVALRDRLHPVQQAMVENFGSQCGYCTPGFIMSLFEGYYRKDLKTAAQLDEQLCGNLCRCTGYRPIRDAAADAFAQRNGADRFRRAAEDARRRSSSAARYAFGGEKFLRPTSLARLFRAMAEHPEARLIAGATELGLEITKKFHTFPDADLDRSDPGADRDHARPKRSGTIGAAATLTQLDEALGAEFPELREMLLRLRLAADSQPRDARRQSRHRLADRRLRAGAARARRAASCSPPRTANARCRSTSSSSPTGRPRCSPAKS